MVETAIPTIPPAHDGVRGAKDVQLLTGYNSFASMPAATALQASQSSPVNPKGFSQIRIATSFEDYLLKIGIDNSISFTSVDFGLSDKFSYAFSQKITKYSVVVIVRAIQSRGTVAAAGAPTLLSTVEPPTSPDKLRQFFTTHGDCWVSSIETGSEFLYTYVYDSQTETEQTAVTNELKAHAIFDGGSITDDLATSVTLTETNTQVRLSYTPYIGGVVHDYPAPNEVVTFARTFPSLPISGTGTVISFEIRPYEAVPGLSAPFAPIAATRELFSGVPSTGMNLSQTLEALQEAANAATEIQSIFARYGYAADSQLASRGTQIGIDLGAAQRLAHQMSQDPTQQYSLPAYESLSYGTPTLSGSASLSYDGRSGGDGGDPFDDTVSSYLPGSFKQGWKLMAIQVTGGNWMNSMQLAYEDLNGNVIALQHGQGTATTVIPSPPLTEDMVTSNWQLLQGGFVTRTVTEYNRFVNQLTIYVDGRTDPLFSLPPNAETPRPFHESDDTVPSGSVLLSFRGHAGKYVDQLEDVMLTLSPARWE